MFRQFSKLLVRGFSFFASVAVAPVAFGQTTLTINGNTADAEATQAVEIATGLPVGGTNASNQGKVGTLLAGTFRSTAAGTVNYASISPVFVFQLPVLNLGETLTAADARFFTAKSQTPGYNADLYGLGFRTSAAVLASDYYHGSLDTSDATLIQDNFGSPTLSTGTGRNTDASGDLALLNYLTAQYAAGAVGGNFVFLRLSPDYTALPVNPPTSSVGYNFTAADSAAAAAVPQLTLTVVPEPGSALLLVTALGILGVCRRR